MKTIYKTNKDFGCIDRKVIGLEWKKGAIAFIFHESKIPTFHLQHNFRRISIDCRDFYYFGIRSAWRFGIHGFYKTWV